MQQKEELAHYEMEALNSLVRIDEQEFERPLAEAFKKVYDAWGFWEGYLT